MNFYGTTMDMDLTLLDFGVYDHYLYQRLNLDSNPIEVDPTFRHDGTSPLPLGMEWSPPPQIWDGHHTVWPDNPHSGWRYCVTIPSWTTLSHARSSSPVVMKYIMAKIMAAFIPILLVYFYFIYIFPELALFKEYYRVQVGIQSPEAITTTRGILRRFSEFLQLFSELQKLFPKRTLPAPPPRKLLGATNRSMIEERRISLEVWMEKLLSNIEMSRSAPIAIFLELEAAVRSSFNDSSGNKVSSFVEYQPNSKNSVTGDASSVASDYADSSGYEKSYIGTPEHGGPVSVVSGGNSASDFDITGGAEITGASMVYDRANSGSKKGKVNEGAYGTTSYDEEGKDILCEGEDYKVLDQITDLSTESAVSEVNSSKASEISSLETSRAHNEGGINLSLGAEGPIDEDIHSPSNLLMALPSDQRHKLSRVLITMQRRLATAKADMEGLVARLDQELAVRQYLTARLTDLEVDLETTKENTKDNLQQAFSAEKERYTQIQWDMEELRKKCLEMELKLKAEQDEKMGMVSESSAISQKNDLLKQELDASRDQFESLQQRHEESETKSKADLKVLVKEVKSLRNSQTDLKQELSNSMKEKLELERDLQNEKQRREYAESVNKKLLHECSILQERLQESCVDFLVEDEDKLVLDTSPSDAIDLLTTSDNRIGLLLAEAQLLEQDVENSVDMSDDMTVNELRKMITGLFIDNASRRKQINSLIRCALKSLDLSDKEDENKQTRPQQTVLGKFL